MRDGVRENSTAEKVRDILGPVHGDALALLNRCLAVHLVEKRDDLRARSGLAQSRKDPRDAVLMRLGAHVGHRVGGERDIEAKLMGEARCRFDADAGRDAGENDLRDARSLQKRVEVVFVNAPQVRFVTR